MGNAASTSPSGNQNLAVKSEDTEGGSAESPSSYGNVNGNNSTANANTTNTTTNNDPQMMFIDCGSCTGALEVGPSTTLAELYHEVVEEFDEEMIPGDGGGRTAGGDYSFRIWVQGVQPTRKQSVRLTVGEINRRNWSVRLVEHKTTRTAAVFSGRSSGGSGKTQQAPPKPLERVAPQAAESVANDNGKRLRETNEETKEPRRDGRPTRVTEPKPSAAEPQPKLQEANVHPSTPSASLQAPNSEVTPSSSPVLRTHTITKADIPKSHETNNDSNPSPLKRSRIFSNPEVGKQTTDTNTNTNTSTSSDTNTSSNIDTSVEANNTQHRSSAVTPIPSATTTEAERNEGADAEHNNRERRSETGPETPRTSVEMEMEMEIEDKPIAVSTPTGERSEKFGNDAMDCDDDDDGYDDDATVAMSLSPSSDRGLADSNEIEDKAGTHDDKQPSTASAAMPPNDDLHAKYDLALKQSSQILMEVEQLLLDKKPNPNDGGVSFCSEARNEEWRKQIRDQLSIGTAGPKTVIGVLGSTGVGKSSLLNALLDEAAVLPTSGSRGCTAAVVELTYNRDLLQDPVGHAGPPPSTNPVPDNKKVPVYKGKVEFMKLEDWTTELKFLVDECSTQDKLVYARCPEEQRQPDAAAAWAKIDQVYGRGTMANFSGRSTASVFQRLATNTRVVNLLTPKPDSNDPYNAVYVEEGSIDLSNAAKTVLCEYDKMGLRTRRNLKRWAKSFRSKINDYVYRKGNGHEAQTWPLIRCVSLQGPWNVLSSGGVLVDLPGVRDANAARARVSERYLQHCNQIWVVAPIKRAVDDGTAKELMGEQFKRRLLMDGQYGNIAFICTQTDDCEATEIMCDHEDIAVGVPGRWESMSDLRDTINGFETDLSDLQQEEEDLKFAVDEANERLEEITSELDDAKNPNSKKQSAADDDDEIDDGDEDFVPDGDEAESESEKVPATEQIDEGMIQELEVQLADEKKAVEESTRALSSWRKTNNGKKASLIRKCNKLQRRLKAICAKVRNEYSTKCLQEDFIAGLKEIYRDANESSGDDENEIAIPTDVSLPVFCISANDYLKVTGIKPSSDGPANCFSLAKDTQIERLRDFVHSVTASRRFAFTESFVHRATDIVDRIKLLANDSTSDGGSTRQKVRCKDLFAGEMEWLTTKLMPIADEFERKAKQKILQTLKPSLASGARKAQSSALFTVDSWGSKQRRTRSERTPDKNGLYWSTYYATARRDGVYVSASAGPVDLNAELVEPMEAEFTPAWQSIMDGALRQLLSASERQVIELCKQLGQTLFNGFSSLGIEKTQLTHMVRISSSNCTNTLRDRFKDMRDKTTENQRELNRSLLPKVQGSMKQSYAATINVPAGVGKFDRMKSTMQDSSRGAITEVFHECTHDLLEAIEGMVDTLKFGIDLLDDTINISLSSIYSILWEGQSAGMAVDPVHQQKVVACRAACLPILNRLQTQQDQVMKALGIERPVLDLEIARVETWEEKNQKKMEAAKQEGKFIELSDDSDGGEESMENIGCPSMTQEHRSDFAKLKRIKKEMPSSTPHGHKDRTNQIVRSKGVSNDVYDLTVNVGVCSKKMIIFANYVNITGEKLSHGFFVSSVGEHSNFSNGEIFPGDIIQDIYGQPVNRMIPNESKAIAYHHARISIVRSAIVAKTGSLGLIQVAKGKEGWEIKRINPDSQLRGQIREGDILTAIDGTNLRNLNFPSVKAELKKTSHNPARRIGILRKDNTATNTNTYRHIPLEC